MIRFLLYFITIGVIAGGVAWFADRPGVIAVDWLGYRIETTLLAGIAVVLALVVGLIALWSLARNVLGAPGAVSDFLRLRRQKRGYQALSRGMIAIGSGDVRAAARHSGEAARMIAGEPLTLLLKAQTAQMRGDNKAAVRAFESMVQTPETEILGLRGLFIEAQRNNEPELARTFAARAAKINPALPWASGALLALQSGAGDWQAAEQTILAERRHKLIARPDADARRAVVLTARALEAEDSDPAGALKLALEAHKLAGDLVPAAVVAGRLLAAEGAIRKAGQILERTWKRAPHPDLAEVYGDLRHGDAPRERLKRVRALVRKGPETPEADIAVARAAIEARAWDEAREALAGPIEDRPTARVCTMMAEIEQGETGDEGRAREWLARALRAPRDPVWTADGYVSDDWAPVSPVTGELGAFKWKVPLEGLPGPVSATLDVAAEEDGAPADLTGDEADAAAVAKKLEHRPVPPVPDQPAKDDDLDTAGGKRGSKDGGKPSKPARGGRPSPGTAATGAAAKSSPEAPREPPAFVAPRPPDDPGPDTGNRTDRRWYHVLLPG